MANDYIVADIKLADWGRREIAIAETGIRRVEAAEGRAGRGLPAHDDPNRRFD
jgi:S-adenosylhomocysteine hydrolase